MTVSELIEALSRIDGKATVWVGTDHFNCGSKEITLEFADGSITLQGGDCKE